MKKAVFELKDVPIYQEVTPSRNVQVEYIRLYLFKFNNPGGSFTIELHDSSGELIATSATSLSASEINSSNFFHGFVRFEMKVQLMKDVTYRIVLKSSGYTFSESAYLGWCNSYDFPVYSSDYPITQVTQYPLSLEAWGYFKK